MKSLRSEREYDEIIYTSPDGERFNQKMANRLSMKNNLLILAGHYKGVDQRIRDHLITMEISIGDYVLSGGEIPAAAITDAIVRLIPGAISDEQSALSDSFQDDLLAPPVYTRPSDFKGWKVPDILLSGNTGEIEKWRHEQSLERTKKLRPDLQIMNRKTFLIKMATIFVSCRTVLFSCSESHKPDIVKEGFLNPPDSARPGVYWYFMDGNLDRAGHDS